MNNKIIGIIVVILVIVGAWYLIATQKTTTTNTNETNNSAQSPIAQGKVIYSITDAALDMGMISEINMTVSSVEMHSAASSWATVSTTPYTYNLLNLQATNTNAFLAQISAPVGTYDQVRLMVSNVMIKMKDGTTKQAKLPSGELKINTTLVVNANMTSSVNFDFMASKSLHMTGNGGYIFAPVVKTETKSDAEVKVNSDNSVTIGRGHIDSDATLGMDIDGSVKLNFELNSDVKLDILNDVINIHGVLNSNIPKMASISMKSLAFNPVILTVKTGTKVTWTNDDNVPHTVTSTSGSTLNSGTISPGQSFSFTFNNEGITTYRCNIHPMMTGTIVVKD